MMAFSCRWGGSCLVGRSALPLVAVLFFAVTAVSAPLIETTLGVEPLHQQAPDLTLVAAGPHQKSVSLKTYRGQFVLLHFWATWCEPCKKELPVLARFVSQMKSAPFIFLPVSVDPQNKSAQVGRWLHRLLPRQTVWFAKNTPLAKKYTAWGIPATYVINPKGEIIGRALGCHDWSKVSIKKALALFSRGTDSPKKISKSQN